MRDIGLRRRAGVLASASERPSLASGQEAVARERG
jgi:hypothetical protein